jgi:hypothetical protein
VNPGLLLDCSHPLEGAGLLEEALAVARGAARPHGLDNGTRLIVTAFAQEGLPEEAGRAEWFRQDVFRTCGVSSNDRSWLHTVLFPLPAHISARQ